MEAGCIEQASKYHHTCKRRAEGWHAGRRANAPLLGALGTAGKEQLKEQRKHEQHEEQ